MERERLPGGVWWQLIVLSALLIVVPAETALMAWLVLGEDFPPQKVAGIALAMPGILLVQWAGGRRAGVAEGKTEGVEGQRGLS